jgi:hypothetical protein
MLAFCGLSPFNGESLAWRGFFLSLFFLTAKILLSLDLLARGIAN